MSSKIVPTAPAAVAEESTLIWLADLVRPQLPDPLAAPRREREDRRARLLEERVDVAEMARLGKDEWRAVKLVAWERLGVAHPLRAKARPLTIARMRRVAVAVLRERAA